MTRILASENSGSALVVSSATQGVPAQGVPAALPETHENSSRIGWTDRLGVLASVGCAIHCAAMPFVIAYLPALGLEFFADESFHQWMAVICFAIAVSAFVPGLRKHRNWMPVTVGCVGLAMISIAAFGFAGECCSACKDKAQDNDNIALAATSDNTSESDPVDSPGCTDGCAHCANCDSCAKAQETGTVEASTVEPPKPSPSSMIASYVVPWLTPLGGIVLVIGHLLNHRFGHRCGCCVSEEKPDVNGTRESSQTTAESVPS